jgi:hypothetical protein
MRNLKKKMVMLIAFFVLAAVAEAQELAPLPTIPSAESLQRMAVLTPAPGAQSPEPSREAQRRSNSVRQSVRQSILVFHRQGLWPLRVQQADGSTYWGEITKISGENFDLLNRKTNQTVSLAYSSVQTIGIAKAYPRTKPLRAGEKTLLRTGEVVEIILMLPQRILEQVLVPQC